MTGINSDRRKFLAASGTALTIAVAGCSGGGGGDGDNGGDTRDDVPDAVDTYLSDNSANGYDGAMVDETGSDSVTVEVGTGDGFGFTPVAVVVDSGTTVTWEWTGEGGGHNVWAADASDFDIDVQEDTVSEEGHTAENTFEDTGNYIYFCNPHSTQGMHGAVIVE